jgi:geranylgeranyl diphosphate synthase, type I
MSLELNSRQNFDTQRAELRATVARGIPALSAAVQNQAIEAGVETDAYIEAATAACLSNLGGGKMVRGCLAVTGFNLYDGTDDHVRTTVGASAELIQACLLVPDDVQDSATLRRGHPAAHIRMRNFLFGQSFPKEDAATIGDHVVQMRARSAENIAPIALIDLDVPADNKLQAIRLLNKHLGHTGLGQALDLVSAGRRDLTTELAVQIAKLKTAYYSFLMPLQLGAALAGASPEELKRFERYSLDAGIAFQWTDDIMGLFGDPTVTGKPPMDDIIEGKGTYLMVKTLKLATEKQQAVLRSAKGDRGLTQKHFGQCLEIIEGTGALAEVQHQIRLRSDRALVNLEKDTRDSGWPQPGVHFLQGLVQYGMNRQS